MTIIIIIEVINFTKTMIFRNYRGTKVQGQSSKTVIFSASKNPRIYGLTLNLKHLVPQNHLFTVGVCSNEPLSSKIKSTKCLRSTMYLKNNPL